eukprot:CAMPEP_0201573290 /NCGR_PEP_ID=MMETSP0190_2-20130828/17044_1 /ASSEMBLY_ACC=CAM_ASM_000263 /TAXON_ID=37353 /ORGANISM="Rosalina sp." /LENGTH=600 /DNA_ID=CAMNT_0048000063 /DNA_START=1884 /DNA_END=3686 /DNA_ORIENTATION=+
MGDTIGVIIDEEKENDYDFAYSQNMGMPCHAIPFGPMQIKYLKKQLSSTIAPPNSFKSSFSNAGPGTNIGSPTADRDRESSTVTYSDRTRTVTYSSPNMISNLHSSRSSPNLNINLSAKQLPGPFPCIGSPEISQITDTSPATDPTELSTVTSVNNFNEESIGTLSSFNWENFETYHLDRHPRKSSLLKSDLPAPPAPAPSTRSSQNSNSNSRTQRQAPIRNRANSYSISNAQYHKSSISVLPQHKKHCLAPNNSTSGSSGSKSSLIIPSRKMTMTTSLTPLSDLTTSSEPKYRLKVTPHDSSDSKWGSGPSARSILTLDPTLTSMTYMTASTDVDHMNRNHDQAGSNSTLVLNTGTTSASSTTCPTPNIDGSSDPPSTAKLEFLRPDMNERTPNTSTSSLQQSPLLSTATVSDANVEEDHLRVDTISIPSPRGSSSRSIEMAIRASNCSRSRSRLHHRVSRSQSQSHSGSGSGASTESSASGTDAGTGTGADSHSNSHSKRGSSETSYASTMIIQSSDSDEHASDASDVTTSAALGLDKLMGLMDAPLDEEGHVYQHENNKGDDGSESGSHRSWECDIAIEMNDANIDLYHGTNDKFLN